MIGFRASSQSSKRGQTWVSIQRVLIPYLCHKSRAPNFRPRTGCPPGNFVAKACRSTCMWTLMMYSNVFWHTRATRVRPQATCSKDMWKTTYVSFDVLTLISDAFEHITQAWRCPSKQTLSFERRSIQEDCFVWWPGPGWWYISNVSAGATMSFYGVSHKDHPWMLDDIKWLPLVMD